MLAAALLARAKLAETSLKAPQTVAVYLPRIKAINRTIEKA